MRLTPKQIDEICQKMRAQLLAQGLIRLNCPREKLLERIQEIFIADLKIEDELNEEVKRLLDAHGEYLKEVDYEKMFELIKKRLIRERGLII